MSEKRPWTRIGTALAIGAGLMLGSIAMPPVASPIYPNIRKVVKESQVKPGQFAPARAGWQGAEMPRTVEQTALDSSMTLRVNKAALLTAAVPDLRAVFAVVLVIVLMRLLRRVHEQQRRQTLALATPINAASISPQERKAA